MSQNSIPPALRIRACRSCLLAVLLVLLVSGALAHSQGQATAHALRTAATVGVADNGTCCFIGGSPDERWENNDVIQLKSVLLSNFEAIDESSLQVSPDSAAANTVAPPPAHPTPKPTSGTPTPKPTSSPATHRKVAVSIASATPTASMVAQDQKKRALISRSEDRKDWMSTLLPVSAGGGALLLIGALWWRFRRPHTKKRE
jgi:hypothetical protein